MDLIEREMIENILRDTRDRPDITNRDIAFLIHSRLGLRAEASAWYNAQNFENEMKRADAAETLLAEAGEALKGVIAVADRKTVEFDAARSVLAKLKQREAS